MRLATIDLGTNTVRLLVADTHAPGAWPCAAAARPAHEASQTQWTGVHQEQRVTRLGEGLTASGALGAAAMARTAATVAEYVTRARALGSGRVLIVATSAVREARNGADFVAALERATGERVEVVSGEDEARLTVRGVLGGLDVAHPRGASAAPGSALRDTLVIFDIGGGSTEYTLVRDGAIVASVSLRLGVVPLAERYPFPAAVEPPRYAAMAAEIGARLRRELPVGIACARVDDLVGTAGTVTTLAALDLGLSVYDARRVQGHRLSRAAIDAQRARLAALTVTERAALPCLEPGRADLIVPGVAIVEETMEVLGVDILVVSDAGLREGVMEDTIARLAI